MLLRTFLSFILTFVMAQASASQNSDRLLPEELSETETQTILKELKPRSHIEATIKISDARINNAYRSTQQSEFKTAAVDVDVYAALLRYAEQYAKKLPGSQSKDRFHCLKKIEQSIFKQSHTLEALMREMPYGYRQAAERAAEDVKKIRIRAINEMLGSGEIINSSNE